MKKFFLIFIFLILFPFVVKGQVGAGYTPPAYQLNLYNCDFTNPKYWDKSSESLMDLSSKTDEHYIWNFTQANCSSSAFEKITYGTSTFGVMANFLLLFL